MRHRTTSRSARLFPVVVVASAIIMVTASLGVHIASADTNGIEGHDKTANESHAQHGDNGPKNSDFVDIRNVRPNGGVRTGDRTGTLTADCGTNEDHHNNPDNFIVAPGKSNGAHHLHDYVGNTSTDGDSTDKSLAKADTTCVNGEDKSAYFWPVLRDLTKKGKDARQDGGGNDHNVGAVLQPVLVKIEFRGNPQDDVVAMPNHLRMVTGDAKAVTNGPKNANAKWTCTGFEDRVTNKYPLCPGGSEVARILDFPGCWDGKNLDSENHRTHVAFADDDGSCPEGFKAIPQLRYTLVYDVPPGRSFAVDSFPEEQHNPVTDHADFEAVMSGKLLSRIVDCVNSGQDCVND